MIARTGGRAAADLVLRSPLARRAALRLAAARQHTVVLLWHRVAPEGPRPHEVVPTVALDRFRAQLDLVQELGVIVPLSQCDAPPTGGDRRPRFALTFDDDDARHARHVLPVLQERGLPATFFLSGRWLHGCGPYWWELLEEQIAEQGTEAVATAHGLAPDTGAPRLGRALTGTAAARDLARRARHRGAAPMDQADLSALASAGMEVGFHTVDHDLLPQLEAAALTDAVTTGRDRLAAAASGPIERFAYPHGGVDGRVAAAVARAGYRSAWTTAKRTAQPSDQPMRRGRWDLGHLPLPQVRRTILRGLARPRNN